MRSGLMTTNTPNLSTCYICSYIDSEDKFTSVALSQHPESVKSICWDCYKAMIGACDEH